MGVLNITSEAQNELAIRLKQTALEMAKNGTAIFPLAINSKMPRKGSKGYKDASTDQQQIERWWSESPIYNIGRPTGKKAGIWVLDVDVKNDAGGRESLQQLLEIFGEFKTLTCTTPSGGFHFYFKYEGAVPKNKSGFFAGIDVRSDGGYIVSPPSIVDGKSYVKSIDDEINAAPTGLADILNIGIMPPLGIQEGKRNDEIFAFCRQLYVAISKRKTTIEVAKNLALLAGERCSPPMPEKEVIGIFNNSANYVGGRNNTVETCSLFEGIATELPPNFFVNNEGVFYQGKNDENPQKICSSMMVLAVTRDENNYNWGRVVGFFDRDGKMHNIAIAMEEFKNDPSDVRGELLNCGLEIAPNSSARTLLSVYIQNSHPKKNMTCASRIGWYGDKTFVLPTKTIGEKTGEVLLQAGSNLSSHFSKAGDLDDWKNQVALPCKGNSRLVFALCAAFAAPLLKPMEMENGGFHFVGKSSIGKSTALVVAGSVFGGDRNKGFIHSWRATSNGIEAIAKTHNDCLLLLDEIGQCDAKEVGECSYLLANGIGKARANKKGDLNEIHYFRLLFLSSGELTLGSKLEETGQVIKAGMEARMIDIPADAGASMGILENTGNFGSPELFARGIK